MKIASLVATALASCIVFLCLFVFVVHKPLTMGIMQDYFERKLGYLAAIEGNKIVILSGSNGRFSHRCETIEELTGIPCTNMAIAAGISIEYQVEKVKPLLRSGDLVYLPLEYGEYYKKKSEVMSAIDIPLAVTYDREYARTLGLDQLKNVLYYFDLKFLLAGIGEMGMQSVGVNRRFSVDTMTEQGDEMSHTPEKGQPYREYLDKLTWGGPDEFDPDSYGVAVLTDFLQWTADRDIKVVGGLPTIFNDIELSPVLVRELCDFYLGNGHEFLVTDTKSQYDRSMFFDTQYHLAEPGQIAHTRKLAPELAAIMRGSEHTEFCVSSAP